MAVGSSPLLSDKCLSFLPEETSTNRHVTLGAPLTEQAPTAKHPWLCSGLDRVLV